MTWRNKSSDQYVSNSTPTAVSFPLLPQVKVRMWAPPMKKELEHLTQVNMSKCTQIKKKVGQCSFLPSSHSLNEFFMCFFFIISGCSDISSEFWSRNDSRLFVGEVKDGLCCFTLCAVFPTHRLYLGGPSKVHLATLLKVSAGEVFIRCRDWTIKNVWISIIGLFCIP